MNIKQMWKTIDEVESAKDIKFHLMLIRDKYEEVGELKNTEILNELLNKGDFYFTNTFCIHSGRIYDFLRKITYGLYSRYGTEIRAIRFCSKNVFNKFGVGTIKGKFRRQVVSPVLWEVYCRTSVLQNVLY